MSCLLSSSASPTYLFNEILIQTSITCTGLLICVAVSTFCYTKIYLTLRHCHKYSPPRQGRTPLSMARYRNTVSSVLWVQVSLVVCYLPYSMSSCPVLLDNSNPPSLVTSVFRKSTYTGLLTNFLSFSPFPYKLGLIRTLVDRTFKINNTWTGFHNNIKELANILGKNQFPSSLVNRTVKQYLNKFFASPLLASAITNSNEIRTHYYKLPFVGPFSTYVQRRIRNLTQRYCKNLDIKLVFAPYKIKNLFSAKDAKFPNYHDPVLFINFLAQAVVPVMSAKQTDILLHVFVNISLLIRTRISFSTLMGQKHADLYARRIVFQSLTPPPHLSN